MQSDSKLNASMIEAINQNNTNRIQKLVKLGAKLDVSNDTGLLPIHVAAKVGDIDLVKQLLKKGVDINAYTRPQTDHQTSYLVLGITPLHIAAQHGHPEIVEILLKHGANVNERPKKGLFKGHSPLYEATYRNHKKVVKQLVKSGANVNVEVDGYALVDYAKQLGYSEIFQFLKQNGATSDSSIHYEPLHAAALKNQIPKVRELVNQGYPMNSKPSEGPLRGWTPLHLASQKGNLKIVKFLIGEGSKIDAFGPNRETPLYLASFNGHNDVVKVLLDRGADPNTVTNFNFTPLIATSHRGHPNVIRSLLEAGANISHQVDGWSSLHYAVQYNHLNSVKVLVNYNADLDSTNKEGLTPLELSMDKNRTEITAFLRSIEQ